MSTDDDIVERAVSVQPFLLLLTLHSEHRKT